MTSIIVSFIIFICACIGAYILIPRQWWISCFTLFWCFIWYPYFVLVNVLEIGATQYHSAPSESPWKTHLCIFMWAVLICHLSVIKCSLARRSWCLRNFLSLDVFCRSVVLSSTTNVEPSPRYSCFSVYFIIIVSITTLTIVSGFVLLCVMTLFPWKCWSIFLLMMLLLFYIDSVSMLSVGI